MTKIDIYTILESSDSEGIVETLSREELLKLVKALIEMLKELKKKGGW